MAEPLVHDEEALRTWESLGPRAQLLTGYLREWLQAHFAAADRIEDPNLRGLLWTATQQQRAADGVRGAGLLVESVTRWTPDQAEQRPAVLLKRNDWAVERKGIGDLVQGGSGLTGVDRFATFVTGSHTLFCVSRLGQEAELLAGEVYREFLQFGPYIRADMGLHRFLVAGVGAVGLLEEARQTFVVPVTIGYGFEERWRLVPHAPVLKRIVLSALLS